MVRVFGIRRRTNRRMRGDDDNPIRVLGEFVGGVGSGFGAISSDAHGRVEEAVDHPSPFVTLRIGESSPNTVHEAEHRACFNPPGLVDYRFLRGVKGARRDTFAAIWTYGAPRREAPSEVPPTTSYRRRTTRRPGSTGRTTSSHRSSPGTPMSRAPHRQNK